MSAIVKILLQWRVLITTNLCKVRYVTVKTNILLGNGGHLLFGELSRMGKLIEPVIQASPVPIQKVAVVQLMM